MGFDGEIFKMSFFEDKKWRTRDGRWLHPSEMDDKHLLRCYTITCEKYIGFDDALKLKPGEMLNKPISKWIDIFRNELNKRGIDYA